MDALFHVALKVVDILRVPLKGNLRPVSGNVIRGPRVRLIAQNVVDVLFVSKSAFTA